MKRIAAILLFFCLATFLFAPTYYVKPDGDDTKDGLSIANAWLTIQKAANNVIANDVVKILPGTYSEAVTESTAGPITYEAYDSSDKPILDGGDSLVTGFLVTADDVTLRNIKATNYTLRGFCTTGDNLIFDGCEGYDSYTGIWVDGTSSGIILRYCKFYKNAELNALFKGGTDIYYCFFQEYTGASANYNIYVYGNSQTVNIYNSVVVGARGGGIGKTSHAGVVNVANCLIFGNAVDSYSYPLRSDGGGAFNYQNCLILPGRTVPGWRIESGCTDGGNNITDSLPSINSYNGHGYFVIRVDDTLANADPWAAKAEEYGFNISFFATQDYVAGEDDFVSRLQALVAAGHEVGNHTKTHPDLTTLDPAELIVEIDDVKTWLEATIGGAYEVISFAYPGGEHNETVRDAVKDAGHTIAGAGAILTGQELTDFEIFEFAMEGTTALFGDGTEATIRENTRGLLTWLAQNNLAMSLLLHGSSELLLTQVGYVLEEISMFSDVTCLTMGELATMVRDSGDWADADGDGERWTRTFIDNSDYRLESTSPCVDAGTDVGLIRDYMGTVVPQGNDPDMGAFEFYTYTIKLKDGAVIKAKDGGKIKIK